MSRSERQWSSVCPRPSAPICTALKSGSFQFIRVEEIGHPEEGGDSSKIIGETPGRRILAVELQMTKQNTAQPGDLFPLHVERSPPTQLSSQGLWLSFLGGVWHCKVCSGLAARSMPDLLDANPQVWLVTMNYCMSSRDALGGDPWALPSNSSRQTVSEPFLILLARDTLSTAENSMTSSERPSPEPLWKKRDAPSRTERERMLEMLWRLQTPWIVGLEGSQPYSKKRIWEHVWSLRGSFPELLPKSPIRTGGMAHLGFSETSATSRTFPSPSFWRIDSHNRHP